jgi:hypothetical protein
MRARPLSNWMPGSALGREHCRPQLLTDLAISSLAH